MTYIMEPQDTRTRVTRKGRRFAIVSTTTLVRVSPTQTRHHTIYTFAEVAADGTLGPLAVCGVTTRAEVRVAIREYVDGAHETAFAH